jgi:CIC family chloride channel protein
MSAASEASTTDGLPVAPSLGPTLGIEHVRRRTRPVDRRVVLVSTLAVFVACVAALVAQLLQLLIALCTNIAFYGRFSTEHAAPTGHGLGAAMLFIPVIGGLIIGVMARYGSKAIRGHGIPEAMEQVLTNESRIPPRMTFLKPLSAAISIGTGGPFGAEGPIIATGGALGSLLGQWLHVSAVERKTLLASGAAAGMAATFGSPVSAVLLAVELLLFEYRPRSLIPVALAATTATGVRIAFEGTHPAFAMPDLVQPGGAALALYVIIGAIAGLVSVGVSRSVYVIEDLFEKLPIHWMWWPALGGLAVGLTGLIEPRVMGVGYDNIEALLSASWLPATVLMVCGLKFVAWSLALGSGTSGGTLAPLLTFGGGVGALLGALIAMVLPMAGVDPKLAALVGMAAMFAGASRALLASVVFAFETTRQPIGLLPLLGGCSMAFLVSALLMKNSIMTEKIERRGVRALGEYQADHLDQLVLGDIAKRAVVTLNATMTVAVARAWLDAHRELRHQGYPVLSETGELLGVITRKDLTTENVDVSIRSLLKRAAVVITEDASMRDAADVMAREGIGRLPVMAAANPRELVGIVTRSDLVNAHVERLDAAEKRTRT